MELWRQLLSIAFVFALLGAAWYALRRRRGAPGRRVRSRTSRLQALDRLPLTASHSIHIVRAGQRALVVAIHPAGATLLQDRAWDEIEPAALEEVAP